ncbi:hypothetical protein OG2516_10181 [Oceanicola granulosus HTCC2516]|uniref:Uncharacterized protein n=1 Tax=Oceanicola granulosus (strain ATCC BAA-861 / DSM 15982 / KCTC 12143 / HTCC2516) TaxID=314256 RepID=Q2CKG7_OCEGH|nr:hypothetical protein [Oceanicola granulosus]EAR52822.1 hypothetical protein OG2516_10181 [Oceanicola granulosus HTCC2516]
MPLKSSLAIAATLAIAAFAAPAVAQSTGMMPAGTGYEAGPPASYTARSWTNPANGCSYSRAHAPGYAPTWHLIMNGAHAGLTNARRSCPFMLVSMN